MSLRTIIPDKATGSITETSLQTKGSELWKIRTSPLQNDASTGLLLLQMRTSHEQDEYVN